MNDDNVWIGGEIVRLKSWGTWSEDGRARWNYAAPKGQVGVFLRLGTEPLNPKSEDDLINVESVIYQMATAFLQSYNERHAGDVEAGG